MKSYFLAFCICVNMYSARVDSPKASPKTTPPCICSVCHENPRPAGAVHVPDLCLDAESFKKVSPCSCIHTCRALLLRQENEEKAYYNALPYSSHFPG